MTASLQLAHWYILKDFDSALFYAGEAAQLAGQAGDSATQGSAMGAIGQAHYFQGHYDSAAAYYYRSVNLLEQSTARDPRLRARLANAYNDLAKLYRKIRDLDRSLTHYDKAETIFRSLRDTAGLAMILNESGVVFEYRGDYDAAISRYRASQQLAERIGDRLSISYSLSNIAGVNLIRHAYDEAEKNLLEALKIRQELRDSFAIALTYSDLGTTLNARGDHLRAINYLQESNRLAEKIHYAELQSTNYGELSAAAAAQSDYRQALYFFQRRAQLRDSLFSLEKTRQIEELDAKYQSVKKEQLIQQQQNRITRQNFLFLILGILALMIALLSWSIYKRYRLKKEKQLQELVMKQQELASRAVLEAEEEERQRIARDLHDGIGQMMSAARMNLSAIESGLQLREEKDKKLFQTLTALVDDSCRELRQVAHNMMPPALIKNNFSGAIADFVNKLDKSTLAVHVHTEGLDNRMDPQTETMLYRIIQECVNNVVRHAAATSLDISIIGDQDGISATVEDNGRGFDTNDSRFREGIGIRNILTRVKFLRGSVEFDSAPGRGTAISLHIPGPGQP